MLYTQLDDYKVKTPIGDKAGKLDDLIIDSETWKITHLVFSKGFFRKERTGVIPADVKVNDDEKEIIVSPEVDHIDINAKESSVHHLYLSDLEDRKVLSSDGEKVGRVYDVEIATGLKKWEVWKLLISTGIGSRRLRISPSDIS
jgi:sporulation protein YlmC with PRC-barrel domain